MYCFSFFSIQITDHSICNFTSFKSKRVYISNEMLLINSLSIYKTGQKTALQNYVARKKRGETGKPLNKMEKYNWFMYITIKIEEINNYPTSSARINLIHACNKMHILHVYIIYVYMYIYRIHIYSETFELCTCTIDPCVST